MAAFNSLLDRGWGKALQRYEDVGNSDLLAALRLAAEQRAALRLAGERRAEPERLEHGPAEDAECEAAH